MSKGLDVKRRKLERTAYHEAGHAVAAYLLDKRFRYVTIKPDVKNNSLGHVMFYSRRAFNPELNNDRRTRKETDLQVLIDFAGQIAEKRFSGRYGHHIGASADNQNAVNLLSYFWHGKVLEKYIGFLWARVEQILDNPMYWNAVEALARELLIRETIKYKDAADIIFEAMQKVQKTG